MFKTLRYSTKLLPSYRTAHLRVGGHIISHSNRRFRSRSYATHFPGERTQSLAGAPFVKIVECGARDGLQNEPGTVDVQTKVELIERLGEAGLSAIESGAMVSKKGVPQVCAPTTASNCIH
jgi:hypothetical protein